MPTVDVSLRLVQAGLPDPTRVVEFSFESDAWFGALDDVLYLFVYTIPAFISAISLCHYYTKNN